MIDIRRASNATGIGPVTVYRWSKGPLLSIECWSHQHGTVLDLFVGRKRSVMVVVPIWVTPYGHVTRIRARRLYRMPWSR